MYENIHIKQRLSRFFLLCGLALYISGCSLPIASFSNNLNNAVMASDDPQTIMQALPAYLILLDSLVEGDDEDEELLMASAKLSGAYAGLLGAQVELMEETDNLEFEVELLKQQQKKLNNKAFSRASRAICLYDEIYCNITSIPFAEFKVRIDSIELDDEDDKKMLYSLGTAWVSWLQVNTDDWNAMAQLPQIKYVMETVVKMDENYDNAGAHMYLGVLNSILPSSLGGKPEIGKQHFEAAIRLSDNKNKMAKVLYAQYYARLIFDRVLHDKLLAEVLMVEESQKNFILLNTLAIQKAKGLQANSEDYF